MPSRILLVEDEEKMRRILEIMLSQDGYRIDTAENGLKALPLCEKNRYGLVITDLKMPELDGIAFMRRLRKIAPDVPVIVITAFGSIETAVEAMKEGAFDYITKPFDREEIRILVSKALSYGSLKKENTYLRQEVRRRSTLDDLVGNSANMREIYALAGQVAATNATVLITGESGTGKELLARAIHHASPRTNGPFVALNCASIPETLLESELFGFEKGAFTGADRTKPGRLELAEHGTLFLDEIGDMPQSLQAKLLRTLQDRSLERLGATKTVEIDVRIIAATNKNIQELVRQGRFRDDLFYRLSVFPIHIPPLRERRDDIALLALYFLKRFAEEMGKAVKGISQDALNSLRSYSWPGNVRELQNVIERAVILCTGSEIGQGDLLIDTKNGQTGLLSSFSALIPPEGIALEDVEKGLIRAALDISGNNQVRAAQLLKISRNTLRYRMEKYGIPFTGGA
jgi:two-component system NtrC family response regulator